MIFYNKKLTVAVCILTVFIHIHKGCTLVFKLNDMGFPPQGQSMCGGVLMLAEKEGALDYRRCSLLNQPLTLTLKVTCLKIRNSFCLSQNHDYLKYPFKRQYIPITFHNFLGCMLFTFEGNCLSIPTPTASDFILRLYASVYTKKYTGCLLIFRYK